MAAADPEDWQAAFRLIQPSMLDMNEAWNDPIHDHSLLNYTTDYRQCLDEVVGSPPGGPISFTGNLVTDSG